MGEKTVISGIDKQGPQGAIQDPNPTSGTSAGVVSKVAPLQAKAPKGQGSNLY
jgi:hypothetical protein